MTGPVPVPPPGPHGGDGARIAAALGIHPDQVLDLSASLNPFAPDVAALAANHLSELRRYPDVDAAEQELARAIGVPADRLVLTGGGAQAIALVAERLGRGWVDEPEFSLYRRHLTQLDPTAPRWRSDPHNPTGRLAEWPPFSDLSDEPGVWDEAFLPVSAATWTRGRPGWSLGSLTKTFACPGLRLGYAVAPSSVEAEHLRRRRPAWAVDGLACALVPELLARADLVGWTAAIADARQALQTLLKEHGYEALPSDAPWLLVPDAAGLRDALASQAVVVRDCGSFGLRDCVRVAVTDERGLERLDAAMVIARRAVSCHTGNTG